MDRTEAKQIMDEARAALDKIFAEHNLKAGKVSVTYGESQIKLSFTGEGQGDASPRVTDWARYAESYGLPVDALGKTIRHNGTPFEITGLAPSRRKFPVCAKNLINGKDMLLTVVGVKNALGIKVEAWERF